MKDFFLKFKNLKFLPIPALVFSFFISYYWLKIFHFSHPFLKEEFYGFVFLQFCFGFIPNFISRKLGRIFTIVGAMVLVRLSTIAHLGFDIPTLNGLFFGAISGIFFREIILEFLGRRDSQVSSKETDFFRRLMFLNSPSSQKKNIFLDVQFAFIIFLMALTLERFILYFNAPFLKNFGILEAMYLPEISSKTAFALSMKTIDSLIFPLLYFFCEERTSPQMNPPQNHWLLGLSIGLGINIAIIFSQTFYSWKIFSENTNLSNSAIRSMGLFRDSGSSSWILPTLLSFFAWRIIQKKGEWRQATKNIILSGLFVVSILSGIKQGRAYWVILIINIFIMLFIFIFQKLKNKYLKYALLPLTLLIFCLTFFSIYKFGDKFGSVQSIGYLSTSMKQVFQKGSDYRSVLSALDKNRFELSKVAIEKFSKNIFFGGGIGSFILDLYEQKNIEKREQFIDSAPSFYLGVLSEIGLFGIFVLGLWFVNSTLKNKIKFNSIFLIVPFFIGYQIVHPDGAFVVLFFILAASPNVNEFRKFEIISVLLIWGVSVFFILQSLFLINKEGKIPDFRKEKIGSYQLSAYEKGKSTPNIKYHIFKGKTAWVLQNSDKLSILAFLDQSTSKKILHQRWSILDENWKEVNGKNMMISGKERSNFNLNIPKGAKYIQVIELNDKGNELFFGDIPFCLPESQFTKFNQFQSFR